MLMKLIKALLGKKSGYKRYSSSDYRRRKPSGRHPSQYGHKYYKKRHKSSGFFRSYSSS